MGLDETSRMVCDHVNGDTLDNRRSNLRVCTQSENAKNIHTVYGMIDYKGVYKDGRTYRAMIRVNGKRISLGNFQSPELAATAYNLAAVKHFGRFAQLNRIRSGNESVTGPIHVDETPTGTPTGFVER
jgi:hypothetical protein